MKGAVIDSEATPDKNKLETGTLTYSDIENKAEYKAESSGVGYTSTGGFVPNPGMPVSGKSDSTTKTAISPGTIIVGGKVVNPENLSRDPSGAVNALGKIFDKKTVQERQELAQMFGEVAFEAIGDLHLKEGSPEKATLDAIAGGIISQITGGNFASGAASAGIHQLLANQLANITDDNVRQMVSYVLGSAVSTLTGGDPLTGGSITLSEVRNNWNKHGHDHLIDKLSDEQIKEVLKKSGLNLSDEDLKKIKEGSCEADLLNPGNDALHAMPETGPLSLIQSEFNKNVQYAIDLDRQGNHSEAMRYLGFAMHTVQDIYSHWARGNAGNWDAHKETIVVDGILYLKPDYPGNNHNFFAAAGDATKVVALIFASGRNTGTINSEMSRWIFGQ